MLTRRCVIGETVENFIDLRKISIVNGGENLFTLEKISDREFHLTFEKTAVWITRLFPADRSVLRQEDIGFHRVSRID